MNTQTVAAIDQAYAIQAQLAAANALLSASPAFEKHGELAQVKVVLADANDKLTALLNNLDEAALLSQ